MIKKYRGIMRNHYINFIAIILACGLLSLNVHGQTHGLGKDAISARAFIQGYKVLKGEDPFAFRKYGPGFEIGYTRVLNNHIQVYIPFRMGNMEYVDSISSVRSTGIDGQVQYYFNDSMRRINPYLSVGLGYVFAQDFDHFSIPLGIGLDFKITPSAMISFKTDYRTSTRSEFKSFAISLGFKKYIGKVVKEVELPIDIPKKDSDEDGIADAIDLCPNIPGLSEFNGCPDTDGDGIPNYLDICPEAPGTEEFGGCPDTDGDGLSDNEDECPQVAGEKDNKGCPRVYDDTDGDGIIDPNDACPQLAGMQKHRGCPDRDDDGVIDPDDLCPESPGPMANYGCPEIEEEEKETLDLAMESVQFETGKAELKSQSFKVLDDIAKILMKYPDYKLRIAGHTDNIGDDKKNQLLSEQRARACYEYLASRGIDINRMSYLGFGESKPRDTNSTELGRFKNRRVEFSLYL